MKTIVLIWWTRGDSFNHGSARSSPRRQPAPGRLDMDLRISCREYHTKQKDHPDGVVFLLGGGDASPFFFTEKGKWRGWAKWVWCLGWIGKPTDSAVL